MDIYPKVFLYRRLVQSKLFIDKHYAEKIDLDNIADEAYCSKFHFIRLFKKIYGKTPHQYLTFVRLEQSRLNLKNNFSVNDTCFAVGFESPTTFTNLFRKKYGVSPSEYRSVQMRLSAEKKEMPLKFIPGCFTSKLDLDNSNFE